MLTLPAAKQSEVYLKVTSVSSVNKPSYDEKLWLKTYAKNKLIFQLYDFSLPGKGS